MIGFMFGAIVGVIAGVLVAVLCPRLYAWASNVVARVREIV